MVDYCKNPLQYIKENSSIKIYDEKENERKNKDKEENKEKKESQKNPLKMNPLQLIIP